MWRASRRAASCRRRSSVGSRLPAFHTALGRVQLGFLDDAEIWRRLKSLRIEPYTPYDHHRPAGAVRPHPRRPRAGLLDRRRGARAGPALARGAGASIAAARRVGAINLSTHSTRITRNEMREHFLPELQPDRGADLEPSHEPSTAARVLPIGGRGRIVAASSENAHCSIIEQHLQSGR